MNLKEWLAQEGRDVNWLKDELGCDYETARRYVQGKRIPRPEQMRRIASISDGRVTPNDFYALGGGEGEAA